MQDTRIQDILDGYARDATPDLIARFDGLATDQVFAPVLDLLPATPAKIVDIGAGTGRDAAWFAKQGHNVLAVEPVKELREAGMALHAGTAGLAWLDDRLPCLAETLQRGPFDVITLCAVWHHLDGESRRIAMESMARLIARGGMLTMSLRHGPDVPGRPGFPTSPEATVAAAQDLGFTLVRQASIDSIQAGNQSNGVRWTWLALTKDH